MVLLTALTLLLSGVQCYQLRYANLNKVVLCTIYNEMAL